ncbi:trypsin-like protease 1 [Beauveria bassiana ARSEF 2860]|uniref:Trypsin-like protease 1 n=1 Tax=Beauveria bassiana (strain ARSEF 2860) TaxID=655819 RepID=J4W1R1_BEAB2|nr:trypsin-like protease 1 [Beauveria bassiana ARSEF 2860]EJP64420.1 trypsin-like protease 1 [Beauveria bassiana ARSEF 2860]
MLPKATITLAIAFFATPALIAAATINKRIVDGQDAKDGEFPFVVNLQLTGPQSCGGTLLDQYTVLTAAHCAKVASISETIVWAGTTLNTKSGLSSNITGVRIHPDFEKASHLQNDIALLYLESGFPESNAVGYAVLAADGSDPVAGSNATAIGWGVTDPAKYAEDTIVCAGGNGKNTCSGDSGGPLVLQETQEVIGITSESLTDDNGESCNGAPSKYTRVGSYIAWISAARNAGPTKQLSRDEQEAQGYCEAIRRGSDKSCLDLLLYCVQNYEKDGYTALNKCAIEAFTILIITNRTRLLQYWVASTRMLVQDSSSMYLEKLGVA